VELRETLYHQLVLQSEVLEQSGYHKQVLVQESNLFWIDEDRNRIKIQFENGLWQTDGNGHSWSDEELIGAIHASPERFSPNVFLRPIIQDSFLPTFAYAGGPGEIAYHAQMKPMYHMFGLQMPVVIPRFSATMVESGIERIMEKLPFKFFDYKQRIEELEAEYIKRNDPANLEAAFSEWIAAVGTITEQMRKTISEIDTTLEGSAGKAGAAMEAELDKLKGKTYRSLKQQEKTQLIRIDKIKHQLFPDGNLQERELAFIYFMNKYGMDIWDSLYSTLDGHQPDSHKLIYL
jgi:bacillithiol biosynthesis cysteine-adding enzyme BshC